MVKQRKDTARGAIYGAGVALVTYTFQVPPFIQEIAQKKKKDLNILCTLPGCFTEKKHKTSRSKLCKYWGNTDDDAMIKAQKEYLFLVYPDHYDESVPMVPPMLLQNCLLFFFGGVIVSSFAYYEQSFKKK